MLGTMGERDLRLVLDDLVQLLQCTFSEILWFLDLNLTVARLEVHKDVIVRKLVTHLQIVREVILHLKQVNVTPFLGEFQDRVL